MTESEKPRITMISSYIPRQCGIATFANDVGDAVSQTLEQRPIAEGRSVQIVALNDQEQSYTYGREVALQIQQHHREDYRNAADVLNNGKTDAVLLQHEYGLFGGDCGEYLLDLLARLRKPLVTTLHSVLSEPTLKQKNVLARICERSELVVVMANRARMILDEAYGVALEKVKLIPHGVPDVPFGDTEPFKKRFGLGGRPMILTFGLLGPGKSIETVLDALAKVVPDYPDVAYVVLGVTHPGVKRDSGELYRLSLERKAVDLGIQRNVLFHNRYVSQEDLKEYLQAADIYVTPYRAKEQITSGTLAYALAAGKAIVSTPYWHAQELLVNGRGRLVNFGDSDGFAKAIRELIADDAMRNEVRKAAYAFGRNMIWPDVGKQYVSAIDQARRSFATGPAVVNSKQTVLLRLSLPGPRLDHVYAMTDDTGILQHAAYATPDRTHGYCTDDNARALIVTAMAWSLYQDQHALPYLQIYLSFLHHAQNPKTGRFRNFMAYDRRWLEDNGSDDCQGRAIWAIGYLVCHAPNDAKKRLATDLFRATFPAIPTLRSPRSWALGILGLHYYLRAFPDDVSARDHKIALAEQLNSRFVAYECEEWPWLEEVVTYDNGRLPQALIIAGLQLGRPEMTDRGLRVLRWLLDIQTAEDGHLSIIGSDGWLPRGGPRAPFDQQALEPAALIGACKAAHRASGDARWLHEMRRCFEWYVGRNDMGLAMVDFKTRGCFDGLTPSGVNENQGAESVLSWLLSLLIMHEMQTGDAPEVG